MAKNSLGKFANGAFNLAKNAGLAYADYQLSALGATDVVKDKYYSGDTADDFAKVGNIAGGISKTVAPALANVFVPGSGTALKGVQQGIGATVNQNELNKIQKDEQKKIAAENKAVAPSFMGEANTSLGGSYSSYGKGGAPKEIVVNIEKDELEVDAETCEVMSDYKDKPKHPKGKDVVNLKGNVVVNKNSVIIPAKMREAYLKGDKKTRMGIIHEVLEAQKEREVTKKMEGGGVPWIGGGEPPIGLEGYDPNSNLGYPQYGATQQTQQVQAQDPNSAQTNLGIAGAAAGTAAALPNLVFGSRQAKESKAALEKLQKTPMPKFGITPEQQQNLGRAYASQNRAEQMAKSGFTPEQEAAFNQNLAGANATRLANAQRMAGGSLAQATNAAINATNINALLDYAAKDAALKRQNIQYADQTGRYVNQAASDISGQRNLMTQTELNQRLNQERALGTALSQGRVNRTNAGSQIAGNLALGATQLLGAQ